MSEDGKGLNAIIAYIEARITTLDTLWRESGQDRYYAAQLDELDEVRRRLAVFRAAVQSRLRVAENSVAAHGCATEAPAAVRELSWVLGAGIQEGEK